MRVLMTGGGTGGHVNPALAIANTIMKNEPDSVIAFVGTERGIENKLVPKAGYELYHVDVRGIRRSLSPANIRALYLALTSPGKAKKLIREFKPDIVIGTGGYVSWPLLVAASKLGIPSAVHESNAVAGLAVRKLIPYVDRIFVNFKVTEERLGVPEKTMLVGCPLLSDFGAIDRDEARMKLNVPDTVEKYVLSFGGSLGAERVNRAVLELIDSTAKAHPEIMFVHAAGARGYAELSEEFRARGLDKLQNVRLSEYIYDMPYQMAAADLVISRAGAITVSELARAGKPCLLIPSPNVTDNQQYKNAKVLSDMGAALLIEESELSEGRISAEVISLLSDKKRMDEMAKRILEFNVGDANQMIYDEAKRLVSEAAEK